VRFFFFSVNSAGKVDREKKKLEKAEKLADHNSERARNNQF
jgi:hypothetical protein